MTQYEKFSFARMNRRSIDERKSKVKTEYFASPSQKSELQPFGKKLPKILAAQELLEFADRMMKARESGKTILFMFGGHVIKCGLAPVLSDLARRGYISAIAGNGSVIIHDTEIALFGETSETVENELDDGMFGMTIETADFLNNAQKEAHSKDMGFGETVGRLLSDAPYRQHSILWNMHNMKLPMTIHPLLGAEVIHPHPGFSGEALGGAAFNDFSIFTKIVSTLKDGIVINFGSAVVMPEIFLKALSAARNIGIDVSGFSAANFDQIQHYRPFQNILKRPTQTGGKAYAFTGHHEIMMPLLTGLLE